MAKRLNTSRVILNSVYALIVLIIAGLFLDAFFQAIPEEGVFKQAIIIAKLAAPGVSDVAKIFLDVIYAIIYGILREK